MIDIELIRHETERVRTALLKRMDEVDLDGVLALDRDRRDLTGRLDEARARRKALSKEIGALRASGGRDEEKEAEAASLKDEVADLETRASAASRALADALAGLPNLPDDRVPAGGKEANQVVRTWSEQPRLGEDAKDHVELCTSLGLVDYERGTKLGGSGFWIYKGAGAALEWALLDFFNREHYAAGYEFLLPPHMLIDECGFAAGQFPKFREDVFHIQADGSQRALFLAPTAETAILNVYRDEILDFGRLPMKAFAYTPCYRSEAGGYRTEERGTIRGHQFNKVEMFQFVAPEDAEAALQELIARSESLVEQLGLHYRTSLLAAKDASASMALTYDVEVWLPSIGQYKEVSSVSWAGDYQARRAKIRFRRPGAKRTEFIHTLNGSGLATSRLLPAIVEQFQQPDGSVVVPEPLRAWVGKDVLHPAMYREYRDR